MMNGFKVTFDNNASLIVFFIGEVKHVCDYYLGRKFILNGQEVIAIKVEKINN
jgi:hypothetical protein